MVRVPPTAGWISQSIRVAAMRASSGILFDAILASQPRKCAADAGAAQALNWRAALPWMHWRTSLLPSCPGEGRKQAARLTDKSNPIQMVGQQLRANWGMTNAMKSGRLAVLAVSLSTAGASTASAAPAISQRTGARWRLAGVVALYSPLLTADEREAVSAFFVGQSGVRYAKKISVTADKIVCKVSNVDITARSCELTFKGAKQTITGRRASEIFADRSHGRRARRRRRRIGVESLSKLTCTLDPAEIKQKAGGGASCSVRDGAIERSPSSSCGRRKKPARLTGQSIPTQMSAEERSEAGRIAWRATNKRPTNATCWWPAPAAPACRRRLPPGITASTS